MSVPNPAPSTSLEEVKRRYLADLKAETAIVIPALLGGNPQEWRRPLIEWLVNLGRLNLAYFRLPTYSRFVEAFPPDDRGFVRARLTAFGVDVGGERKTDPHVPKSEGIGRVDEFRLREKLGQGGSGEIYRATDERMDRDVALKRPKPQHRRIAGYHRVLKNEARMTRLGHPSLLTCHQLRYDRDNIPYLVHEYVPGTSLRDLLFRREDLTATRPRFLDFFVKVTQAVAVLHRQNPPMIHCDLKPDNVLVTEDVYVKVIDFGFARVVGDPDFEVGWSPDYASPEQLSQVTELDARADVYSLGCVLADILLGLPCRRESGPSFSSTTIPNVRAEDRASLLNAARATSKDRLLYRLAADCLSVTPSARPADAGVVAERVNLYFRAVEEQRRKTYRQGVVAKIGVGLLSVALLAGGVLAWGLYSRSEAMRIRGENINQLYKMELQQKDMDFASAKAESDRKEAERTRKESKAVSTLTAVRVNREQQLGDWPKRNLEQIPTLAFADSPVPPAELRTELTAAACGVYLDAVKPKLKLRTPLSNVAGLAIHPNATLIAIAGQKRLNFVDDAVILVDARTYAELGLLRTPGRKVPTSDSANMVNGWNDDIRCLTFSPDGRWLAAGTRYGRIHVWDCEPLFTHPVPFELKSKFWDAHVDFTQHVSFTADSTFLVSQGYNREWSGRLQSEIIALPANERASAERRLRSIRSWEAGTWKSVAETAIGETVLQFHTAARNPSIFVSTPKEFVHFDPVTLKRLRTDKFINLPFLSPNGLELADLTNVGIDTYDLSQQRKIRSFISLKPDDPAGHQLTTASYSPCGRFLVTYDDSSSNAIRVWETCSGRQVAETSVARGDRKKPVRIQFAPNGKWFVVGYDQEAVVVRFGQDATHTTLAPHAQPILTAASDAAAGHFGTISHMTKPELFMAFARAWAGTDPTGTPSRTVESVVRAVDSHDAIAVSPDGKRMAFFDGIQAKIGGTIRVVTRDGDETGPALPVPTDVSVIRFTVAGEIVYIESGEVHSWNPTTGAKSTLLTRGRFLASAANIGTPITVAVRGDQAFVGTSTGFLIRTASRPGPAAQWEPVPIGRGAIRAIQFVTGSQRLVVATDQGSFVTVGLAPFEVISRAESSTTITRLVGLSAVRWATAGGPNAIEIWGLSGDKVARRFSIPLRGRATWLHASEDGSRLYALVAGEYAIRAWDLRKLDEHFERANLP